MNYQHIKLVFFIGCLASCLSITGCSSKKTEKTSSLTKNEPSNFSTKQVLVKSEQPNISTKEVTRTGVNQKVDPRILALVEQSKQNQPLTSDSLVKTKESDVQVYIVVAKAEESDISLLKELGLDIEIVNTKLRKIQAWVPLENINRVANSTNVLAITTPNYGSPRTR